MLARAPGDACVCVCGGGKRERSSWVCVEWHFDPAAGAFELWVDGEAVSGPTGALSRAVPAAFPSMSFGVQVYQPNAVVSGWMDDIAVSSSGRVGCAPPPPNSSYFVLDKKIHTACCQLPRGKS